MHREAAYAKYFIGQSYLAPLVSGKEVNVSNVTFEAGCRNNWHIHHKACQILIAVGGRGYYQEWGKEPVELNPGDVVYVAPETKHWHGAAPDSDFAHIAIMNAVDGASNEWLEPVEAEYDALRRIEGLSLALVRTPPPTRWSAKAARTACLRARSRPRSRACCSCGR